MLIFNKLECSRWGVVPELYQVAISVNHRGIVVSIGLIFLSLVKLKPIKKRKINAEAMIVITSFALFLNSFIILFIFYPSITISITVPDCAKTIYSIGPDLSGGQYEKKCQNSLST